MKVNTVQVALLPPLQVNVTGSPSLAKYAVFVTSFPFTLIRREAAWVSEEREISKGHRRGRPSASLHSLHILKTRSNRLLGLLLVTYQVILKGLVTLLLEPTKYPSISPTISQTVDLVLYDPVAFIRHRSWYCVMLLIVTREDRRGKTFHREKTICISICMLLWLYWFAPLNAANLQLCTLTTEGIPVSREYGAP